MLPTEDLRSLQGRPLIAADGDKLGGIEEIYCDKATNEPEWFGINTGFLGTKRLVVPVEGATVADDGIHVPYTSDVVKDAPGVDMKEISVEEESELYRHYGIAVSRAESPTLLPARDPQPDGADMVAPSSAMRAITGDPALTPGTVQPIPSGAIGPALGGTSSAPRDRWDIDEATGTAADVPLSKPDSMHVRSAGTQSPSRERRAPSPSRPRASAVRAFVRDAPVRAMLTGAAAGVGATIPMTVAMIGLRRILPGENEQPLPPREIAMRAASEAGADTQHAPESRRRMLTTVAHAGYGAANGALYASTLGNTKINPVVGGAAFGAGLWTAGYAGWLPASGLYPPARNLSRGRNVMMLTTNMLWGIVAAMAAQRMRKPLRDYKVKG